MIMRKAADSRNANILIISHVSEVFLLSYYTIAISNVYVDVHVIYLIDV